MGVAVLEPHKWTQNGTCNSTGVRWWGGSQQARDIEDDHAEHHEDERHGARDALSRRSTVGHGLRLAVGESLLR